MSKKRVFSSCRLEFKGASPPRDLLEGAGFEVVEAAPTPGWPDDETRERLAGVDGLVNFVCDRIK